MHFLGGSRKIEKKNRGENIDITGKRTEKRGEDPVKVPKKSAGVTRKGC